MVITPWGSDVLRAKKYQLRGLRKLVQKSNWVTCTQGSRFEKDIVTLLDIPKENCIIFLLGLLLLMKYYLVRLLQMSKPSEYGDLRVNMSL